MELPMQMPRFRTIVIIVSALLVLFGAAALLPAVLTPHTGTALDSVHSDQTLPPLIINKVDPWTPLKGLDGIKPCFDEPPGNRLDNWAFAWIEVHNTTNETLKASGIQVEVTPMNASGIIGENGSNVGFHNNMTLSSGEDCLIPTADRISTRIGVGGGEGHGPPPGADKAGAIVSINYTIAENGSTRYAGSYQDSTPALYDQYGDAAYWELQREERNGGNYIWKFIDPYADERENSDFAKTMTLTSAAKDDSIIVNVTMPIHVHVPAVSALGLSFINSTSNKLIDDGTLVYEIEYKGIQVIDGYQKNWGRTVNGTDTKFLVMNQTGPLDISIKILALNKQQQATGGSSYNYFDEPKTVSFSTTVMPEFSSFSMLIMAAAVPSSIIASRYL